MPTCRLDAELLENFAVKLREVVERLEALSGEHLGVTETRGSKRDRLASAFDRDCGKLPVEADGREPCANLGVLHLNARESDRVTAGPEGKVATDLLLRSELSFDSPCFLLAALHVVFFERESTRAFLKLCKPHAGACVMMPSAPRAITRTSLELLQARRFALQSYSTSTRTT